ncbi:Uncharacterised protein [Serratia proteamaculans]|uniref:hypothetical protein n=1 Tax=Serratia proteamaculans TaxID=28151 RepID=UPI002178F539|nr:hypothetical protein [Serratia proteamaculans]CAI2019985.1 Uncharacterised protein [Serratia proteamaculans]
MKNPGNDNSQVDWQRKRKFVAVVEELRQHHPQLWFRPGVGVSVPAERQVKLWTGCEVLSAEGRILAWQTGNANQWQLSANYRKADRYPFADDDIEGCQELTEDFFFYIAGYILITNMY